MFCYFKHIVMFKKTNR